MPNSTRSVDQLAGEYVPVASAATIPINRSGTITTGGTAQVFAPSNSSRLGFRIRNNSAGSLYINVLGTATATNASFELKTGEYFESPASYRPFTAISIIGATTGQEFFGEEW